MVNKMIDYLKGFFLEDSKQSMMRLMSLLLVCSGILVVLIAVIFQLDGGHYGLELAILGVLGKGYQKKIEK